MNKVGRKKTLNPEKIQELRAKAEFYQRVKKECGPTALCRDYHISLTSLRTYTLGLHKHETDAPEISKELTAEQVDMLLSRTLHQGAVATTAPSAAGETTAEAEEAEATLAAVG